jgi:hypothetical protein
MKPIQIFVLGFGLFFGKVTIAQQLNRQVIAALGNSISTNGIYLSQTIGQGAGFTQVNKEDICFRQGFQQAVIFDSDGETKIVQMVVYPNPNNGIFYVLTNLPRGTMYSINIYDIQGNHFFSAKGEGGIENRFELPFVVAPGNYPASIETENGMKAETKIVIL